MKKSFFSFLTSLLIIFIANSIFVVAIDVSRDAVLSGNVLTSNYTSYSVNFDSNYSSIGSVCLIFTFSGDLLDPSEQISYSLVPAPTTNWYGAINVGNTSESTRTSCITPAHTGFNEFLDGVVTASVWMTNGTVSLQNLNVQLKNVVVSTTTSNATQEQNVTQPPEKTQLSLSLTVPKETYYPAENFEPKLKITDSSGKLITDATVKSNITIGGKTSSLYFYFSYLCDCYKAYYWISESSTPGDFTLVIDASHPNYKSSSLSKTYKITKPSMRVTLTTDKAEYAPGDTIYMNIDVKDENGNAVSTASINGEVRDTSTNELVSILYAWLDGKTYKSNYWLKEDSLGKTYKISFTVSWKEQKETLTKEFTIAKKGLNADVLFEKTLLKPGDMLRGKIKVYDKNGNTVDNAYISVNVHDANGYAQRYLSAKTFKDGYYEIDEWKVEDWQAVGNYTVKIKITSGTESVDVEKSIEIVKEKLNVEVNLDQTSYRPGSKAYVKVLVAYPNGTVVKDAYVSGEMFPLFQPTDISLTGCRWYLYFVTPVYYKGEYIQKYFIDSPWIPESCQPGKYVVKINVGAISGYGETEEYKEFEVAKGKLFIESGIKIDSSQDSANIGMYAEVKDENNNAIPYIMIKGSLRPATEGFAGCIKAIRIGYDDFAKRYSGNLFVSRYDCLAGAYLLQLVPEKEAYESTEFVQKIDIRYVEGFEYRVLAPPSVGGPSCREVSCGDNCVQRICEQVAVGECFEEVTNKECVQKCVPVEQKEVGEDAKKCLESCVERVPCRGYAIERADVEKMMAKLDELRKEVEKTQEDVGVLKQMLLFIIDFVNSILSQYLGSAPQPIKIPSEAIANATNATNPMVEVITNISSEVSTTMKAILVR